MLILGRSFLDENDPKPAVQLIERTFKIYPYASGGVGTSIAEILTGKVKPGRNVTPPPVRFVDASGKSFNTIPPSDFGFYEMLNKLVQEEPADALGDPERMGQVASIGIVKGKPFQPDARMRKILTEAAAVGQATSRTLVFRPRESEGFALYLRIPLRRRHRQVRQHPWRWSLRGEGHAQRRVRGEFRLLGAVLKGKSIAVRGRPGARTTVNRWLAVDQPGLRRHRRREFVP